MSDADNFHHFIKSEKLSQKKTDNVVGQNSPVRGVG